MTGKKIEQAIGIGLNTLLIGVGVFLASMGGNATAGVVDPAASFYTSLYASALKMTEYLKFVRGLAWQ